MKKMIAVLLPVALLIPAIAGAKSPFDGTWKLRVSSIHFSGTPDNFTLVDGGFGAGTLRGRAVRDVRIDADRA